MNVFYQYRFIILKAHLTFILQVWVLTGDKEETAVNISYSAGHFSPDMEELRLTKQQSADQCGQTIDNLLRL